MGVATKISELSLQSSMGSHVPELPNILTLLHHKFPDAAWANFLHRWENIIFSVIIAILLSVIFHYGMRKRSLIPSGLQNFLELLAEALQNLIYGVLGKQLGEKYFPFLATLFVYILTMNLIGFVPFMKSPSANLNITAALAICVFVLVQYLNIRNMGVSGFLYHLAGSPKTPLEWFMVPLMFPIELLTQFSRPITLSLRLFGNILGEDILIGAFAVFGIAMLATFNSPVGVPLQIPFLLLGLLTSLMQALVFTLLTTIYILLSIPHSEKKH